MFKEPPRRFHRCYISAPFGIDLGSLPSLLGQRQIAWNWAAADVPSELGCARGIERCDFVVADLDARLICNSSAHPGSVAKLSDGFASGSIC